MFPAPFEYYRAGSVDEALALLGQHEDAKLLAGGHSLLPMMKLRLALPPAVIDIGRLAELRGIEVSGGRLHIGSLVTHGEVATSEVVRQHAPVLAEAAAHIGDPQVRHKGTVGGNIAHADPASDLPAVLRALGATVHLRGAGGSRSAAADDFFVGLLETLLEEHEILTGVELPVAGPGHGGAYLKVEHPASGYAVVGAAAVVTLSGDSCTSCRLCFNGVSATPHDATGVSSLVGGDLGDDAIASALDGLRIEDPLSDLHASGEYRVHLAKVYGRRALQQARDRAAGG